MTAAPRLKQLFISSIGAIYLFAFISLALEIQNLIGPNGILPAEAYLKRVAERVADPFWFAPSIFWIDTSNEFLMAASLLGIVSSILVIFRLASPVFLFLSWLLYLSFTNVSQAFLSYQWDILLLEIGFLTIFLALLAKSKTIEFLIKLVLFKLMFMSGFVKLASQDPSWLNLNALDYHYETQPLANPLSWLAHQVPAWLDTTSVAIMFFIELICPFFIWGNRSMRRFAFFSLISLQILIMLTGNYCFFNLLSIALCFILLDDKDLSDFGFKESAKAEIKRQQAKVLEAQKNTESQSNPKINFACIGKNFVLSILCTTLFSLHVFYVGTRLVPGFQIPELLRPLIQATARFKLASSYGLFAVMTKKRNEIIIEGSQDGENWQAYEFRWKPGKLDRLPAQIAPMQPRVDWQMWFAALTKVNRTRDSWFIKFVTKLLLGDKEALAFISHNPFPEKPPEFIRASLYEYHFTDISEFMQSKNFWKRKYIGEYLQPIRLLKP